MNYYVYIYPYVHGMAVSAAFSKSQLTATRCEVTWSLTQENVQYERVSVRLSILLTK